MSEFRKSVYSTQVYSTDNTEYQNPNQDEPLSVVIKRNKILIVGVLLIMAAIAFEIIFIGNPTSEPAGAHIQVRPP